VTKANSSGNKENLRKMAFDEKVANLVGIGLIMNKKLMRLSCRTLKLLNRKILLESRLLQEN